ncbi:hypothetical protein AURDEDRAFT_170280 [Auricularia subglabra TFB-10046 SS5]|nr:hypothetical protein AURDEDRAFT_170280 [Auricularia subglabra TFB-10046 SS5]
MAPRKQAPAAAKGTSAGGASKASLSSKSVIKAASMDGGASRTSSSNANVSLPEGAKLFRGGRVVLPNGATATNAANLEKFPQPRASYQATYLEASAPRPKVVRRMPDIRESPWVIAYPEEVEDIVDYMENSPPPSPKPAQRERQLRFDTSTLLFPVAPYHTAGLPENAPKSDWLPFLMRCMYLEQDMLKERRRHRQPTVVKMRHQLQFALAPPRPKLPVNDAFREWIGALDSRDAFMPTNYMPEQDYDDEEEFMRAMSHFCVRAQEWLILRKNEALCVKIALDAEERKPNPPQRPEDLLAAVVPVRVDPSVYIADPTAPPILRGHHWWTHAYVTLPPNKHAPYSRKPRQVVIVSNVDFIPQMPPITLPRLRVDGHYGVQEESRFPQWHMPGRWHMAFIPTDTYGGVAYHSHSDVRDYRMECYMLDLKRDFITHDGYRWTPSREFKMAIVRRWDEILTRTRRAGFPQRYLVQRPIHPERVGRAAMLHLFNHELEGRVIAESLASWQRSVAELDGWFEYTRCRISLQAESDKYNGKLHRTADLRYGSERLGSRGVFTEDPTVAAMYAQHGAPVWLVQPAGYEYWTAGGDKDRVEISPPFPCETRLYDDAHPSRQPAHLAHVQEYYSCGPPENYVPAPLDDEPDNDDEYYNDCDVVMQDDGPIHDAGQRAEIDVVMHESARRSPTPRLSAVAKLSHEVSPSEAQGGETKRKREESPGAQPDAKTGKKKNKVEALGLPSYPKIRHLANKEMPAWWPTRWPVAFDAVTETEVVIRSRVKALREDPTHPIPSSKFTGGVYATPTIEPFMAEMHPGSVPANTSAIFARYTCLRATLLACLARTPLAELGTLSPRDWKEVLGGNVKQWNQERFAIRLGFSLKPPPAIVEDADNDDAEQLPPRLAAAFEAPDASESTSTSLAVAREVDIVEDRACARAATSFPLGARGCDTVA